MDIYATEDEQADAIKKWIKTNAPAIIIGIVLGLGGLKGWDYWQLHQLKQNATASAEYEAQILQIETAPIAELEAQFAAYSTRNDNQVYNNFLQLKLAKKAIQTGDFDVASTALNKVIADAANKAIKHTAVLRLARILIAKDKAQDAINLLNSDAENYKELYAQVRGDAYLALGEVEKARQAYLMAKGKGDSINTNLQMKIDNLAILDVPVETVSNETSDIKSEPEEATAAKMEDSAEDKVEDNADNTKAEDLSEEGK